MSTDLVNLSHKQKNLSLAEHSILNILAYRANDDGECWPSVASLVESSSADRKTVIKVLQSLSDKKLIFQTGKMAGRTKRVPVYKLNLNSPKNGTVQKINSTTFSDNSPKNGTIKQSQKRDMERSYLKDQRKRDFSNSEGPKTLKELYEKLI
jgi:pyocin large subunit-like protein